MAVVYRLIPNLELNEEHLRAWFELQGWVFGKEVEADPETGRSHDLIWVDVDSGTTLHLIDDSQTGVRYVALSGERAKDFYGRYHNASNIFYEKEPLLQTPFHGKDSKSQIRAIFYVGMSAPPEYDADYYRVMNAFLGHPDPQVRVETVAAIAISDWPEFGARLEELRDEDPDPRVANAANDFLTYSEK